MFEIIATILGLIQGVLVMLNKRSNWLVYAAQMVALVIFSYQAKLYGDMWQNVFYFFFCLYSWWIWKKGGFADKIKMLKSYQRICGIICILCLTYILGVKLCSTDDPMPFTDSFTTITAFAGLILMSLRRVEAWVVWFFNDIAYMYQYFNLPDQALYLFALYVIWTVLAAATFINWLKIYNTEHPEINEPTYYTGME
jgi:nicotinamide mononucleotide transporter PnuC